MNCQLCNDTGKYKVCIAEVDGEEITEEKICSCVEGYTKENENG